ncbi:hypothetical protein EDD76_105181 [Kineothrix alysoides]|uniref:Uncharacterized protein n=1 Tax=Kineothrix alysoides TaxID=1469948 RepID=A0A4R1R113_9FIRM|nr:DUF6142 family protein [Kineothrix alysoides]TCL59005.1 hypothetical protein EDD76_105181 [Kineothrix alysoides]
MNRRNYRTSRKGGYIFTTKKHPEKGIMSTALGIISIISIAAAVYLSYRNAGAAVTQYGAAVFLVTLFSLAGLVLGILSRMEKDRYYLFSYLGIGFNVVVLAMISIILYAGAYGV